MPSTRPPSARWKTRVREGTSTCTSGWSTAWHMSQASAPTSTVLPSSSPVENMMRPDLLKTRTFWMLAWRPTLVIIS